MNVIFDFNGTLFPDGELHYLCWKRFFEKFGIVIEWEDFLRDMCGPPNPAILRQYLSPKLTDKQIADYTREKESYYQKMIWDDPSLKAFTPGVPELLDTLKDKGIRYAIATGSGIGNVDFYFETLGIGKWFDRDRVFYSDGSLPGKPNPAIYQKAMQKLGFKPEETIVFEDAVDGVTAAAGAGIKRIVAIDLTTPADRFARFEEVIAVVHDFRNVLKYIVE